MNQNNTLFDLKKLGGPNTKKGEWAKKLGGPNKWVSQ